MTPKQTLWPRSPHTAAKHELLTRYLDAWYPIAASQNRRIVFFDGFAGPGIYAEGEAGSPILALERLLNHRHLPNMTRTQFVFLLNEQHRGRHDSLKSQVSEFQAARQPWPTNISVQVVKENFRTLATELLAHKPLAPMFAFVDPFGYKDIPISLLAELLTARFTEMFVYFDLNSTVRFGTANQVDDRFDDLFGTDEYKLAPASGSDRKQFLHDLYARQLRDVCGFPYVQSFEMINETGHTGNYLFFCTRNATSFDKMKSAMWKVDPASGCRFSDRFAGAEVLFQPEVDTAPLRSSLLARFAGMTADIAEVTHFTITETPFVSTHVKVRTLRPMQLEGIISSPNQRTVGQFPDGTLIAFPPVTP